jgi:hypothetical protein
MKDTTDDKPRVLGVRFGVNPNSSSLGVDVTYLLFGGAAAVAAALFLSAWIRGLKRKAEPRETMGRILEHVGEPWDDAVLDHPSHIPAKDDMPPFPWLEVATRARAAPECGWPGLTPVQIRIIERLTRQTMKGANYAPAELAAKVSLPAVWLEGLREVPESVRQLLVYYRHTRAMSVDRDFVGEALAWFRRINPEAWARYPGFEMPVAPVAPSVSKPERPPVPRIAASDLHSER